MTRIIAPLSLLWLLAAGCADPYPRAPYEPIAEQTVAPVSEATSAVAPARTPAEPATPQRKAPEPVTTKAPTVPVAPTAPPGSVRLETTLSNTHLLMPGDGRVQVQIDLRATEDASGVRMPLNLALVIDRSGSMRGEKMEQTREAARKLIAQLTREDTLAIVSYSDDVRVDLMAQRLTDAVREQAMAALAAIRPGGSTNLSGGLFRGQEEVARHLSPGRVNRVILMSDGLANRGVTDVKAIAGRAQKESQQGVTVTTMGVGTDYNEDLMTAVADHAGGNYYFISESKQIASVLTQELARLKSSVASAAVVEVRIADGTDLDQVFGYTFEREGDLVRIPLAELFAGQKRSILLGLRAPVVRAGPASLCEVKLTYRDATAEGVTRQAMTRAAVTVTKDTAAVERTRNRSVEERLGEVKVAHAMNTAADLFREGAADKAQQVLSEALVDNDATIGAMGGSARLATQSAGLAQLKKRLEEAEERPAEAAREIKATKAKGRLLAR